MRPPSPFGLRRPGAECPREHEVVAAVLSRRLDRRSLGEGGGLDTDEELRTHAAECEICGEAVTVAALLREEGLAARRDVHVPAAGQVWWRAAIRARVEAVHAAERPMTWLHGLAGACAVGLVAALLGAAWPSIERAAAWVSARSWSLDPATSDTGALIVSILQRSLPFAAMAVCMILATLAIYVATSDD